MKKVLVTTDFSANSKAGMRFAIQWASQQPLELVFIHALYLLKPVGWSDSYFDEYCGTRLAETREKIKRFTADVYRSMKKKPGKHSFVVIQSVAADVALLDYCKNNSGFDYICISTRGAGKLKKIFGTNTGNLITKSPVPVVAIPHNYRASAIKKVLYASDFKNYTKEADKVVAFAKPLKAAVDVLHFAWPEELIVDQQLIETAFRKQFRYDMKLHVEKTNVAHTLIRNLQDQVKTFKPSVVVMFTNQKRGFFGKLFLSSKAEEFSFRATVPLLVFGKQ